MFSGGRKEDSKKRIHFRRVLLVLFDLLARVVRGKKKRRGGGGEARGGLQDGAFSSPVTHFRIALSEKQR